MTGYLVTATGPQPFARWQCHTCDVGSGSCILPPGAAGDDVRDKAIDHQRRTGHDVVFTRGTMEVIECPPTTRETMRGFNRPRPTGPRDAAGATTSTATRPPPSR